jgi:arginine-tRNA-protein transferase
VRVVTGEFQPNASQRKVLKRHADLDVKACRPWATDEQFQLLRRYLDTRHPDGGMAGMDDIDYADMVEQTPVSTSVVEYREPSTNGRGRLVGACVTDQQNDGLSMIYSFFAADDETRPGLGNFIIMDHILRAAEAGLPYVYLGYWINGSRRMEYKTKFRPIERLGPQGWFAFDPDQEVAPSQQGYAKLPV